MKKSPLERIRPEVRNIAGYHLKAYDCPVKLNQNESPFDIPEDLKDEILEAVRNRPWSRYPQPMQMDLVEALAQYAGWNPEGLIVCNGSNTLVQLVLAVTTTSDTPVVVPSPSFSLYGLYTGIFGGREVAVNLNADYTFNMPAICEAIRRENANMVILCSPNNPTGCVVSNADLEALLNETDALVLVDEAYAEFSNHTALDLLPNHPNLIVLKTFSKALGAAGIRIGYLMAHPEMAQEIIKAKIPFDINVFSHTAALKILEHQDLIQERVAHICTERDRVFNALSLQKGVRAYPSHANLILFEVEDPGAVFNSLVEQGILIRNVTSYPMLSKALRVSIGSPEENDRFLKALAHTLKEN
ncbi:MAG: histidinol-phosphate transaminase [bacterium]|nr:histidinol-phosphate transaminase [bacterium]